MKEVPPLATEGHLKASSGQIVLLSAVGVLMTSVLVTLPVLAAAMARQVGGGDEAIGYLAAADMFGCAIACLVIARRLKNLDWRMVIGVALLGVVIGNLASMPLDTMAALLLARLFVGFCGGAALSVVFVALCHTPSPDRSFGIFVFLQLLLQAAALPVFALLYEQWGVPSLYAGLIALALLALLMVGHVPRGLAREPVNVAFDESAPKHGAWATITVVALGIYFIAPAMIWAFFEPIGRRFDLDPLSIGSALGFSALAGIAGAGTVLMLAARLGRLPSMAIGIGLSMISLLPVFGGSGMPTFLLVTCVFNFAWNFTYPYLMGVIAHYDEAGEVAIYSLATQLLGLAAGPLIGSAILASQQGYPVMVASALLILFISLLLFARSETIGQRLLKRPPELAR